MAAKERPAKRRRLSESSSHSASSEGSSVPEAQNEPIHTLSRIKPKTGKQSVPPPVQIPETLPQTILSSIDTGSNKTFSSLGVDQWLVSSLAALSVKIPTRIQASCIPEILKGKDCIGGSRTGSGKTIAFTIPILQQWARDPSGIFGVILTPTRELALQIHEQISAIGIRQGIKSVLVTGGADMRVQALELSRRPHLVIATPGRLADHILNSGEDTIYGLRRCRFVVLDEADRLLAATGKGSMLPDVETCLDALPPAAQRQTCLFTATITPEVRALQTMPRDASRPPVFLSEVDTDALAIPDTLTQTYQLVNVMHKEKYLHVLLLTPANLPKPTIIFTNRTTTATLLEHLLRSLDHRVTSLHSGLSHADRTANLARFRAAAARILVATDIAARGLDIPAVALVINYDLPRDPADYIHRVGRTARAGRPGTSVSFVGQRDVALVQAIEARVGREMQAYSEENVAIETRVVRDALNLVGDKKREALLAIEEGRDVKGKRVRKLARLPT